MNRKNLDILILAAIAISLYGLITKRYLFLFLIIPLGLGLFKGKNKSK